MFLSHANVKAKGIELFFKCCLFFQCRNKNPESEFFFFSVFTLVFKISFLVQTRNSPLQTTFLNSQSTRVGGFSKGVVPPNPPPSSPQTRSEKPLSCNAEWTEKYKNEREERKSDCKTPTLFFFFFPQSDPSRLSTYIFFSHPSLPPSFIPSLPLLRRSCRGMPPSPPTSIVWGRARGQEERRGAGRANKGALLLPRWGLGEGRHQAGGVRVEGYRRSESVTEEVYH